MVNFVPFGVAILTRVSTVGQAEGGVSLAVQEDLGRRFAAAQGLPVVEVFTDAGVSGDLYRTRDGLQECIAGSRAGRFNVIWVYDQSRLTWSLEYLPLIHREIQASGSRLYVHMVGRYVEFEDYQQEFFGYIQGAADRFYRLHQRAGSMRGQRELAAQGRQPIRSKRPYGYDLVTRADILRGLRPAGDEGHYVPIPEEAAVVLRLYEEYAAGQSLLSVQRGLAVDGIKTMHGKDWERSTLLRLLKDPRYKGEAVYGRFKAFKDETRKQQVNPQTGKPFQQIKFFRKSGGGVTIPCPAIVSVELWERVQAMIERNKRAMGGNPLHRGALTGLIVCPICRQTMHNTKGTGAYAVGMYQCRHSSPARIKKSGQGVCNDRGYRSEECETLTAQAVQAFVTRQDVIAAAVAACAEKWEREREKGDAAHIEAQIATLEKQAASVESKRAALLQSDLDPDFIAGAMKDLGENWRGLQDRLAALRNALPAAKPSPPPLDALARVSRALVAAERVLTSDRVKASDKTMVLRGLVESITPVDNDLPKGAKGRMTPHGLKVDFLPLDNVSTVSRITVLVTVDGGVSFSLEGEVNGRPVREVLPVGEEARA